MNRNSKSPNIFIVHNIVPFNDEDAVTIGQQSPSLWSMHHSSSIMSQSSLHSSHSSHWHCMTVPYPHSSLFPSFFVFLCRSCASRRQRHGGHITCVAWAKMSPTGTCVSERTAVTCNGTFPGKWKDSEGRSVSALTGPKRLLSLLVRPLSPSTQQWPRGTHTRRDL